MERDVFGLNLWNEVQTVRPRKNKEMTSTMMKITLSKAMGEFSTEIIEKATKQTVITGDDMTGSSKSNEKELVDCG